MKRSHRIALKPTFEQEVLFGHQAGYAQFAQNWAVSERTLRPWWNKVKGMIAP